jgi:hypothetical protein
MRDLTYNQLNRSFVSSSALLDERLTWRDCRVLASISQWRNQDTGIIIYPGRDGLYEMDGRFLPPSYMLDGIIEKLVGCGYLVVVGYNRFKLGIG